jgi:hypothetical protein
VANTYYQSQHWRELRQQCLVRDHYRCTADGCRRPGTVADHIQTRPDVSYPTVFDTLENLRTLCRWCDAQVKEAGPDKQRKQGGVIRVKGCDVHGWPLSRRVR